MTDLQADGLTVLALLKDGRPVQSADAGDAVIVITNQTPFYAESGGQVGDTGVLTGKRACASAVEDTARSSLGQFHRPCGRLCPKVA